MKAPLGAAPLEGSPDLRPEWPARVRPWPVAAEVAVVEVAAVPLLQLVAVGLRPQLF